VPIARATPWVSALLIVTKEDDGNRVRIDAKPLSHALQRSVYCVATVDDVLSALKAQQRQNVLYSRCQVCILAPEIGG